MEGFDVVILSSDIYLKAALCEEVRLMGYTCGFDQKDIGCNSIIISDLSLRSKMQTSGNRIIYIANSEDDGMRDLHPDDVFFVRPFSLCAFSSLLRELLTKNSRTRSSDGEPSDLFIALFDTFLLINGKRVDLTENEMIIFRELWNENGKAVSHLRLEELTGANGDGNMVAVYISRLRSKFEEATDKKIISTVREVGYRLSKQSSR